MSKAKTEEKLRRKPRYLYATLLLKLAGFTAEHVLVLREARNELGDMDFRADWDELLQALKMGFERALADEEEFDQQLKPKVLDAVFGKDRGDGHYGKAMGVVDSVRELLMREAQLRNALLSAERLACTCGVGKMSEHGETCRAGLVRNLRKEVRA